MGLGLASWSFLLQLILLLSAYGSVASRELKEEPADQSHHHDHMHAHHSSHMAMEEDPSKVKVFFTLKDLKAGNKIPTFLPNEDHSTVAHFLPRQQADSIPFSSKHLPHFLDFLSIPRDSPQAKAMEDTLMLCESDPLKDEIKTCATSLESMLDFARRVFGRDTDFKTVTTKSNSNVLQNFTILEVKEIDAPKMVACHYMPYAYAIYGCHSQMTERINKVFRVSMEGENRDRVAAVSACHLDTSEWSPNHLAFKMLGIKPGTIPVCHFFPTDHLVFVPAAATDEFIM